MHVRRDVDCHALQLGRPSLGLVILCLGTAYAVICGLNSFYFGPAALLLSLLILLLEALLATELLNLYHPTVPWLVLLWLSTSAAAATVGIRNYHISYAPYAMAKAGRRYEGVDAAAKASAYLDAGLIIFEEDALLDEALSVGARALGTTYCVAPVVSRNKTIAGGIDAQTVQFWAVGLDCCGARGTFGCNDATEPATHSGLVWHEPGEDSGASAILGPRTRDRFMAAVEASCALHGLAAEEEPVLLYWVREPDGVLQKWVKHALFVWVFSSFCILAVASTIWFTVHHYFEGKLSRGVGTLPELEAKRGLRSRLSLLP